MNLEKVTFEGLKLAWPPLVAMLEANPMLWSGWTLERIRTSILSGQLQLWLLLDEERRVHLAALTQLVFYAEGIALRIVWAVGEDVRDGFPNIEELEELARRASCQWVEILGRRGWERPFRRFGYKVEFSLLRKNLGGYAAGTGSIH